MKERLTARSMVIAAVLVAVVAGALVVAGTWALPMQGDPAAEGEPPAGDPGGRSQPPETSDRPGPTSPRTGKDPRPDLILIVADDQRNDTLWAMPTVQEELVGKGVTFTNAMVPQPLCCPSRASFLTGRYSHHHGVWTNKHPTGGVEAFRHNERNTLATWLQDSGYRTLLAGKYLNGYNQEQFRTTVPPGWSDWLAFSSRATSFYYATRYSDNGETWFQDEDSYSTTVIGDRVATFIRETPVDQPLFAMLTPNASHGPFQPEEKYAHEDFSGFEKPKGFDLPYRPPNFNGPEMQEGRRPHWLRREPLIAPEDEPILNERNLDQLRTLLSVDDAVAGVLEALEETGRLENTMIVYTADQGLFWGEHRLQSKAAPYDAAARIPMVIRYDPVTGGKASKQDGIALNIDIAPTFAALAETVPGRRVDGASLIPLLSGKRSRVRERFVVESAQMGRVPSYCGARTADHLYVRWDGGEEELIDYRDDPWELVNRAKDPASQGTLVALREFAKDACWPRPPGYVWG